MCLLKDAGQYPIAKIVTWSSSIDTDLWITDLRPTVIGLGNMRAEVYDPDWLAEWQTTKDVFDMDLMKQWNNQLWVTPAQVELWNSYQTVKQDKLVSWENIVTINDIQYQTYMTINPALGNIEWKIIEDIK